MKLQLQPVNKLWFSTAGDVFQEKCEIITKDEGNTFVCLTHNKECKFNEGVFCPVTGH